MVSLVPATQDEVRRNNLSRLLRLLHLRGATSRARLTALTGLNRSTVGALTTELVEAGLVRESTPVGRGRAGRPSILVEPEAERTYVLALDLGVEHVIGARIGLGGDVLDRRELPRHESDHAVERIVPAVVDLLEELSRDAASMSRCVGVGIGIAGVVGTDGNVRFAPNLGWVDVPLSDLIADRFGHGLPVRVANDGDLGALGEHVRGAATGLDNVVYVSGEIGVGGGVILDGKRLRGAGGYAGEIGHMAVNPRDGRLCRCGRRGCWETEIGEEAVLLATGAAGGSDLVDVLAAYRAGEPRTVAGLHQVGYWMGVGVANLVNMFNPEMVVFGGHTSEIFHAIADETHEGARVALSALHEQVRLEMAALGTDSTVIGAGELAFTSLLDNPIVSRASRLA